MLLLKIKNNQSIQMLKNQINKEINKKTPETIKNGEEIKSLDIEKQIQI